MKKFNRSRVEKDPNLAPLIIVSLVFHAVLLGVFTLAPSLTKAGDADRPKAIMFNLEVADTLGSGVGGSPKKGPVNDGKIVLPPPEPEAPPPAPTPTVAVPDPGAKKKPTVNPKPEARANENRISNTLRDAINQLNEGRTGEYTRPDGDPNAKIIGPAGPPGGDTCAIYRGRASRYIRKTGSVPEAAGKTVKIVVSISASGAVSSKRITQSSGVPVADKVALGLVPGSFGVPPPECGSVTLHVTVRFEGGQAKLPPRPERPSGANPPSRPSSVPSEIDRALQEIQ